MGARALATLFAVATVATAGWAIEQHRRLAAGAFEHRRAELLLAENERLRALLAARPAQATTAAPDPRRKQVEAAVEEIRELKFLQPVVFDVVTHAEIKRTLESKIAEQFSDAEIRNLTLGLAALGLLDRDYPLKQKFLDLLGEQVAAFYDQHAHKLFMFEDAKLDRFQNRIILSHELTHALQDQHFGLGKLPLEIKSNDDRAIAASALVEGEATLVMSRFMLQNLTGGGLLQSLGGMLAQNSQQIESAPRYLRETLLFPYVQGQEFCTRLQEEGGWQALSDAFAHPPSSSAQILHPEKYLARPREEPLAIGWRDTGALGKKPIADNVLGELGIRILIGQWLDAPTAEKAATGWRGDRYLVFDDGRQLVWLTRWQSAVEANRFIEAMVKCREKRQADDPSRASRFVRIEKIEESGVLVIDASTQEWAAALAGKFARD